MHYLLMNALKNDITKIRNMLDKNHFSIISTEDELIHNGYIKIKTIDFSIAPEIIIIWLKNEGFTLSNVIYSTNKETTEIFINGYIK